MGWICAVLLHVEVVVGAAQEGFSAQDAEEVALFGFVDRHVVEQCAALSERLVAQGAPVRRAEVVCWTREGVYLNRTQTNIQNRTNKWRAASAECAHPRTS